MQTICAYWQLLQFNTVSVTGDIPKLLPLLIQQLHGNMGYFFIILLPDTKLYRPQHTFIYNLPALLLLLCSIIYKADALFCFLIAIICLRLDELIFSVIKIM